MSHSGVPEYSRRHRLQGAARHSFESRRQQLKGAGLARPGTHGSLRHHGSGQRKGAPRQQGKGPSHLGRGSPRYGEGHVRDDPVQYGRWPPRNDSTLVWQWERRHRRAFPGREFGGQPLECGAIGITRGAVREAESRNNWAAQAIRHFHAAQPPLGRSLEVGPCGSPLPLEPLVRNVETVDHAAALALCKGTPTIVDDGQYLQRVPSAAYDVLVASHVLEHMNVALLALRHWLRVLRPGGLALLLLPDPCTRGFMDRFRLALPAAHHVDEYRSRQVRHPTPPATPPPQAHAHAPSKRSALSSHEHY